VLLGLAKAMYCLQQKLISTNSRKVVAFKELGSRVSLNEKIVITFTSQISKSLNHCSRKNKWTQSHVTLDV